MKWRGIKVKIKNKSIDPKKRKQFEEILAREMEKQLVKEQAQRILYGD